MHSNNDGMDPYWRPEPIKENENSAIYKLKKLSYQCWRLSETLKLVPRGEENTIQFYKVTLSDKLCSDFVKAYETAAGDL